jgi:hypothetical protein
MQIPGIDTGVDFEQYTINLFKCAGIEVHDTPKSNDYGADLVVMYNDIKFAGQCKYYSKAVGVKAVQEIIGSLNYYQAQYGMVITNDTFTQQAKNLANTNNVLLIDEKEITSPSFSEDIKVKLDDFLEKIKTKAPVNVTSEDWVMNDLIVRYGVSQAKVLKDFLGGGLPYYKVGREYRFNPQKVKEWEVQKGFVSYGRNEKIELPEAKRIRLEIIKKVNKLKHDYNLEEANGNTEQLNIIAEELHKLKALTPKEEREKEAIQKKYNKMFIIGFITVLILLILGAVIIDKVFYNIF